MRIGLIGAQGFVGSAIATGCAKVPEIDLVQVMRTNYEAAATDGHYDVLINAAMPSRRFWARHNPGLDFVETVVKTSQLLYNWSWGKFVQISSISARSQLDTVYGRHKAAAEKLCSFDDNLVLRLGPMYGEDLDKGVLIDLLNDSTVFVSADSRYCFAPIEWIGEWIPKNLHLVGVMDLGGTNAVALGEVAEAVGSQSTFEGVVDDQILTNPVDDAPSARDAIEYLRGLREKGGN